jgi:hypothetical protein
MEHFDIKVSVISHFAGHAWGGRDTKGWDFFDLSPPENHFRPLPGDSAAALIGINFG